jgi:GAF domain-containing protein
LLLGEDDLIANMANVAAALKEGFGFFWVGFYRVVGDQLVLGPFQGPVACSRIAYGKGVCGTAWKEGRVVVVPDVDQFPGHIACSSLSRSEIVVPVWSGNRIIAVLDIDSDQLDAFDEIDAHYLEKVCDLLRGKKRATVCK